ncbi:hypothetical protein JNUCC64_04760 [Streptomyces sp. JNUCC 64]
MTIDQESQGACVAIRILIEGTAAERAARELAALDGVDDTVRILPVDPTLREPVLMTVAAVVGIVAGSAALAEQITRWWGRWRGRPDAPVRVVVIVDGRRVPLRELDGPALERLLAPPSEPED